MEKAIEVKLRYWKGKVQLRASGHSRAAHEEETHTIKGTPVKCEVENVYCQHCGSKVYIPAMNDANLDRMDNAYRKQEGIIID